MKGNSADHSAMFSVYFRSVSRGCRAVSGLVLLCWLMLPSLAAAVDVPDRLKAAYLYNFAKLTYWPGPDTSDEGPASQLIICSLASEELTQALKEVADKPVQGRTVQVVGLGLKSRADFCQMVFIDAHHARSWFRYAHQQRPGQLLVGESEDFIEQGGIVRFYLERDKLRFEISLENANRAGVQISSRLLKLARVKGGKP